MLYYEGISTLESYHMNKEKISPVSRYRYLGAILHFYKSSFLTDIFPHVLQVYQMGVMRPEEIPVTEEILELLQMLETRIFLFPVM